MIDMGGNVQIYKAKLVVKSYKKKKNKRLTMMKPSCW